MERDDVKQALLEAIKAAADEVPRLAKKQGNAPAMQLSAQAALHLADALERLERVSSGGPNDDLRDMTVEQLRETADALRERMDEVPR